MKFFSMFFANPMLRKLDTRVNFPPLFTMETCFVVSVSLFVHRTQFKWWFTLKENNLIPMISNIKGDFAAFGTFEPCLSCICLNASRKHTYIILTPLSLTSI